MEWFFKFKFIAGLEPVVMGISALILLSGFLAYRYMVHPIGLATKELKSLAGDLAAADVSHVRDTPLHWLRHAWEATDRRVLRGAQGDKRRPMLLGSVSDLWQPERLLHKEVNFRLFEAAPNIAVGVGLLCTFVFLTQALTEATAALTLNGGGNPVDATRNLLGSAGGKFLSSLAGLIVSLCWTFAGKRALVRLERACVDVVDAIEKRWPPVAAEEVVMEQLTHLRAADGHLTMHHETAKQHLGNAQDRLGVAEEMLEETREQTGVLKRFETDLAVSIGNAVTSGFSPQMEQMTARLETVISSLSERVSTMNEDALRKMMEDFSRAISANTAEEMQQFKTTLTELSARLGDAGGTLQDKLGVASDALEKSAGQMAQSLDMATQKMTGDITIAAQSLVASVQGMDAVMEKAAGSVKALDATLARAATLGAQGVEKMDASMTHAGQLLDRMGSVGDDWSRTSGELKVLAAQLVEACNGIDALTKEQHAVARAVNSAGPQVQGAVAEMRQQLESMARSVSQDMKQVQDTLGRSSADLTGVVNAIKDGVVQYSQQLAKLHQAMDAEMSKAVNRLGGAIQTLDESIGELTDNLDELGLRK